MLVSSVSLSSLTKRIFFGKEPTPELIAILLIYFVQGILGLASLAVSFFLKDDLRLSPVEVSVLMGIGALPWVVKPLFGFMSDGWPILKYRRRPYLILAGLLGSAGWGSMATVVDSAWTVTIAIALGSLSIAVSDAIVDSIVVERAREESLGNLGTLQSLTWGAAAMGGLITAYLSGFLLEHFSNRTIFGITATFPLIVSIVAWLIAEEPVSKRPDISTVWNQVKLLRQAVSQKAIWMPAAFILLWKCRPSPDAALFFFTTNELGFEPEFLGRVRLVSSVASLVGIWLFQKFIKNIPFRTVFGWTTVLSAILGMTMLLLVTHTNRALGIDDRWFSIGDSLILSVFSQIAFMPVLVLAARLCPLGVEATLFALLMSVNNFGGLLSGVLGAGLTQWFGITETNFDRLWLLIALSNLSNLLPLLFLNWLPAEDPQANVQALALHSSPNLQLDITASNPVETSFIPELMPDLVSQSPESSS